MRKRILELEQEKGEMKRKVIELNEDMKYFNTNESLFKQKINTLQQEKQAIIDSVKEIKGKIFEITKGAKLSDLFYKKITKLISVKYNK